MKQSFQQIIDTIYRYYSRAGSEEAPDLPRPEQNERLVNARREAGAECSRWLGMLQRLGSLFPESGISNLSIHLKTGQSDACYSGSLSLPNKPGERWHTLEFKVSLLGPYYIIYSSRGIDDLEETERIRALAAASPSAAVFVDDTMFILPAGMVRPEFREAEAPIPIPRQEIAFEFSPDEQPYASAIAQEIEATWDYEPMPPDVGKMLVPDVVTDGRRPGEATLYDCLFSEVW